MSKIIYFTVENKKYVVEVNTIGLFTFTNVLFRGQLIPIELVKDGPQTSCRRIVEDGIEIVEPIKFY